MEKRMRVMGIGGKRDDRTVCKGHTAQFTRVKETIWLQFLVLSHSELLNSLFVHVGCVCLCICVGVRLCVWINVLISVFAFVCLCMVFWQPVLQMHRVVIV